MDIAQSVKRKAAAPEDSLPKKITSQANGDRGRKFVHTSLRRPLFVVFSSSSSTTASSSHHLEDTAASGDAVMTIHQLPTEMLCYILSYLPLPEQLKRVTDCWLEKVLSRMSGVQNFAGVRGVDMDIAILIRHCHQLVTANLYMFRVTVSSLKRLCQSCPKLKDIILPKSCDDACVEELIDGLPELSALSLTMNKTSGRFLSRLPASLRRLSLSGRWKCQPTERLPATSITELDISGLWDPPPAALASLLRMCPRLERLNAKECSVTDSFVEQLPKRTPGIRDLNLEGCGASAAGLLSLGLLRELRRLNLMDTDTTDAVLLRLHGLPHLSELAVGTHPFNGPDFSLDTLADLVASCPSLRLLVPTEMVYTDVVLDNLVGRLEQGRRLTVAVGSDDISDFDERIRENPAFRLLPYEECDTFE
ncbi:uncharacterized protein LOC122392093 isoform X3 [Amphibalanus amphitrite]|uniref:uncharacterized protein LOC122392093 isoform X3 n=1 Tax=Amphibalanus amphitrite TaxID=1232801 RepID=UPI001C8FB667|nr:uncharacterized protein LOC122392093 isoform X3 [Amphibalanus amphitrite]